MEYWCRDVDIHFCSPSEMHVWMLGVTVCIPRNMYVYIFVFTSILSVNCVYGHFKSSYTQEICACCHCVDGVTVCCVGAWQKTR